MKIIGTAVLTAGMGAAALGLAAPALADAGASAKGCNYTVTAHNGLNVRDKPQGKKVGALKHGHKFVGSCTTTKGYVQLLSGVPKPYVHKWVYGAYLHPKPKGGVATGGGASQMSDHLMLGSGIGAIALGGGLALTLRRRRISADS